MWFSPSLKPITKMSSVSKLHICIGKQEGENKEKQSLCLRLTYMRVPVRLYVFALTGNSSHPEEEKRGKMLHPENLMA